VVRSHRPGDVFELVFPCILEQNLQLVLCILLNALRYADAARIRNSLQTRRHVHTSAEDVPPSLITSPKFTPMWNSTFFPRPVGISIPRLHVLDRGERVDPEEARGKLRRKFEAREKPGA
jgi:hypothetical protein